MYNSTKDPLFYLYMAECEGLLTPKQPTQSIYVEYSDDDEDEEDEEDGFLGSIF